MRTRDPSSAAPSLLKIKKSDLPLIERILNRVIADGFRPYAPDADLMPSDAVLETARRLDLPADIILALLANGDLRQNEQRYNGQDPFASLRKTWLDAGFEATGEKSVRQRLIAASDEIKKLKKILEKADRAEITAEQVRTEIYGLKETPAQIPETLLHPRLSKGIPGIPMINASDWHYGEIIAYDEMGGYNFFSMDEADRRIKIFAEKTIEAAMYYNHKMNYPGLVVCLSGDLFSGDGLHLETDLTNEARVLDVFTRLQGQLIWFLQQLADAFPVVMVYAVVGNHGRNTAKPQSKQVTATNYEYLLYNQLELFFQNNPAYRKRVLFHIPREIGVHFTVGADRKHNFQGHRYYLMHGDRMGASGGRGIIGMIGPIVRGAHNVQRIETRRGRPFDTLIIGHFHDYNILPGVLVNGTLKGIDEYALHKIGATPKPPSQAFWFNHKRYAPVIHQQLILDDPFTHKGLNAASFRLSGKSLSAPSY